MSAVPTRLVGSMSVLLVFALAVGEGALAVRLVQDEPRFGEVLALHGFLAAGTVIAAYGMRSRVRQDPVFLVFAVSAVFLGPLGIVGGSVAALARRIFALRARPFGEWYASLFPETAQSRVQALYQRLVLRGHGPGRRVTVAPFADVMALGSLQEKQTVIGLIAARFRPEYAPALRAALNDPEAAVRVQAASAVARIEQQFLQKGIALEERLAAAPGDRATLLDAAEHHEALAQCGLIDEGRAEAAAHTALKLRLRLLAAAPKAAGAEDCLAATSRLLLRLDRPDDVVRLLAPAVLRSAPAPQVIGPYLEGLFRLRRFVELRATCLRLTAGSGAMVPEPVRSAMRLWTESEASAPRIEGAV